MHKIKDNMSEIIRLKLLSGLVCFVLLMNGFGAFSQIEMSKESTVKEEKERKEKKVKESIEKDSLSSTSLYFNTNWSYTPRKLEVNDGLFGDSLGERANEIAGNRWSFGLGFRNQVHKHIAIEGGIAFMRNSEKYNFEGVDTAYSYVTEYSYLALPIKIYYTYGKEFKFLGGVGITPQMFIRYKQDRNWETTDGKEESETIKTTTGFNSFAISATISAGIQIELGKRVSVQVIPEYRIQLNSSNTKQDSYKHYARAIGVNAGLVIRL